MPGRDSPTHAGWLEALRMQDERAIRQLVRKTLGCKCPDTVFEHIERAYRQQPTRVQPYAMRLVIGKRLLIYLLERASLDAMQVRLADILDAGRDDRDTHGYNRFRAVICGTTGSSAQESLQAEWIRLAVGDDRLHLHLVVPEDVMFTNADPQAYS